jgi:hypothetical protein
MRKGKTCRQISRRSLRWGTTRTVLYRTVLYRTVLYRTVLYCTVLYCTVLYVLVLYCTYSYCTYSYCTVLVLYCTVLYCTVLYCTVLYCTVCTRTVLYVLVLYVLVLYCTRTVLYCTVLYCTVLYCTVCTHTVLYCTVLYVLILHCTQVGYRWYHAKNVSPAFAFGHGLSFTDFEYAGLKIRAGGGTSVDSAGDVSNSHTVDVSLAVTNTGSHTGAEVQFLFLFTVHVPVYSSYSCLPHRAHYMAH